MYPTTVTTAQPYPHQFQSPSQYPPYPHSPQAAQPLAPYPAGQQQYYYAAGGTSPPYYQPQPQVIYRQDRPRAIGGGGRSRLNDPNTCWLVSLLGLCCGCLLGEALCDQPCCCCLIPCALPRFR